MSFYHSYIFFFNVTATTEIYTLSLHDALPISLRASTKASATSIVTLVTESAINTTSVRKSGDSVDVRSASQTMPPSMRSEEHTSELQSQSNLVCRLLLEKKKKRTKNYTYDQHL